MVDWNALIEEHGPLVIRISWRILGRASDVEDNVQDVFLNAYRLQQAGTIHHWRGLMRRLATFGALARRRQRRSETLSADAVPFDRGEPPEEVAIRRELEAKLRDAVAALPEREGAVFCLRYFEELDLPEIAASLGIKYSAAATALCRARARLEGVLADTVVEDT